MGVDLTTSLAIWLRMTRIYRVNRLLLCSVYQMGPYKSQTPMKRYRSPL